MTDSEFRPITDAECALLGRLLDTEFKGRDAVREQINHSLVRVIDENGSLEFNVQTDLEADVEKRISIEGQSVDVDGMAVHFLLHVVERQVRELEIYKDDSSPVVMTPQAKDLELIHLA